MAHHVTIRKFDRSLGVVIPSAIARRLGLSDGSVAQVTSSNGRLIIRPIKKRIRTYTLAYLLKGYRRPPGKVQQPFGPPQGRELI